MDLIKLLDRHGARQKILVEELRALWADPAERMKKISEIEPVLKEELSSDKPADSFAADVDDSKSEFSQVSYRSTASYLSRSSAASSRSGVSVVSVLSNVSLAASSTGGFDNKSQSGSEKSKTFSIQGLEHSLLSRGSANSSGGGGSGAGGKKTRRDNERSKRKRERKPQGFGPDLYGITRETAICDELASNCDIFNVAKEAAEICECLLVISGESRSEGSIPQTLLGNLELATQIQDYQLAALLQRAVDEYALILQSFSPPVAPQYPHQWLKIKLMESVVFFQEFSNERPVISSTGEPALSGIAGGAEGGGGVAATLNKQTWWQIAADGILRWKELRRVTLQI